MAFPLKPDHLKPDELGGLSQTPGPSALAPADLITAARAFQGGDEWSARQHLADLRAGCSPEGRAWAEAERLWGLVSIHLLREVEGTFALERADACLERLGVARAEWPDLSWLGEDGAEP